MVLGHLMEHPHTQELVRIPDVLQRKLRIMFLIVGIGHQQNLLCAATEVVVIIAELNEEIVQPVAIMKPISRK